MKISSEKKITEKEGYEAMLYMLLGYWELTGSNDLTDILSGGSILKILQQTVLFGNIG
jgi:hypothetical protein